MTSDIHDLLTKYLTDAHAIEEQALAQLRTAPKIAGTEELSAAFRDHLGQTEGHERTVASLLSSRDAKPSKVKDTVMALGGKGFVLFARSQPDTPGKLLAHAISYEALEEASYDLLGRVATRAGEPEVAAAATSIREEERAMRERLEGCFDGAVTASLEAVGRDDLQKQVRLYLADAHAIEEQAIALLERAEARNEAPLAHAYGDHLAETRDQAELVAARLQALGGDTSTLKDAALRFGALNWAAFFEAHPDTPGKLAAFSYAFEYLEIGAYEQLKRVAQRAGDEPTVELAERILAQERGAAGTLSSLFDDAAQAALAAQGAMR